MSKIKQLKDLNLLDRFLFSAVMEDEKSLESILEIILGTDIALKDKAQVEKELRRSPVNKRVYFDVYGEDVEGTVYDAETQKRNTGDLPQRTRYYNGMVDLNLLEPGEDYRDLKDTYVIMITPFDLFGKGRYKYTFRMICEEVPEMALGDGATRIFLNTRGTDSESASEELIALLHYFEETTGESAAESNSERIQILQAKVEQIKNSEEMGIRFMNAFEEKMLERREGREEGKKDVARKMLDMGMKLEIIAEATGFSEDELENLRKGSK